MDTAPSTISVENSATDRDRAVDHKTTFARLGQIDFFAWFSSSAIRHECPSTTELC